MITTLAIHNYALIEDIRVDLQEGFTIITGETGAGKSIILGALALLLGKRAELASVKDASKKCVIEGEFAIGAHQLESVFKANDLDYDAHTIIRREILPGGKSRAFVNDTPVNLNQLQALGPYLVDVHSQNETLALSQEGFQMEVIDALAGNSELLREYITRLDRFKTIVDELELVLQKKNEASKELDYNTFLYNELQEASLEKIDQTALEESYELLNHAEEISEGIQQITQLFTEEPIGTLETAKEARIVLGRLRNFSVAYDSLWERVNSVIIELEDITEALDSEGERVDADPQQLLEVNEKLQTLYKLQKKHNVASVEELVAIETELAAKIDVTGTVDQRIAELEKQREEQRLQVLTVSEELHQKRVQAIPKLKEKLEDYLSELGLPNARFSFDLLASKTFRINGTDTLTLLFTANKGTAMGPLKKIASGGEMSRIMLAVKAVLAQYRKLPALVFDEIDTGVSGEIAHKMATIMRNMSRSMQIISITHLPQIAAKGTHHIKVYKEDEKDVTVTRLKALNEEERIVEIAQMIGGSQLTDASIAHAKELLN